MDLHHLTQIGLVKVSQASSECSLQYQENTSPAQKQTLVQSSPNNGLEECLFHHKGTPLDSHPARLSVLSYNLLAPSFVRPIDKRLGTVQPWAAFEWAEPSAEVLAWDARCPRLQAELKACRADIICLQEVEFERQDGAGMESPWVLPAWMRLDGYKAEIPLQKGLEQMAERNRRVLDKDVAIGCALLYRSDRVELVGEGICPAGKIVTIVAACFQGRSDSPLALLDRTVVVSVHLDATSEDKRVDQLSQCLHSACRLGVKDVIIAGDMNSEFLAGSCISALLADTPKPMEQDLIRECKSALRLSSDNGTANLPTADQLSQWKQLWEKAALVPKSMRMELSRVPTGATRCAYDHGKTCGPCVSWRLDHIFYTMRTLHLHSAWGTLEDDPRAAESGLPNHTCPSDHLPIAAIFVPSRAPHLGEERRTELLRQVDEMESRHKDELATLENSFKLSTSPATADQKRESRRLLREKKEQHAVERKKFVDDLEDIEKDALEPCLTLEVWLKSGTRPTRQQRNKCGAD